MFGHQESGFTLVELLIAMAISGIVLGAAVNTFIAQRWSYALQEQVTEMTQGTRAAMELVTREVRMAGYKPMVLVSYKLNNNVGILQTKLSHREGHEARRIGLEAMPLHQHIK